MHDTEFPATVRNTHAHQTISRRDIATACHCAYQCGMNGSNHSDERDRQPLEFCPECQAKLWWTCRLDPLERSRALEAVARKHAFERVAADLAKQSEALSRS